MTVLQRIGRAAVLAAGLAAAGCGETPKDNSKVQTPDDQPIVATTPAGGKAGVVQGQSRGGRPAKVER